MQRDGYLPGVPCWVDTNQPDPDAAATFYGGLFGWVFEDAMPPGSAGKYLIARLEGGDVAAIASQPEGAPPMAVWNTYVWVDSADEAAARVLDAGGRVVMDPFDVMDAGRMAVLTDPEGATFREAVSRGHTTFAYVDQGEVRFGPDRKVARAPSLVVFGDGDVVEAAGAPREQLADLRTQLG